MSGGPDSTPGTQQLLLPILGAVAAATLALTLGTAGRWAGAALLLALLPGLVAPIAGHPLRPRFERLLPVLLVIAAGTALLWPLLIGQFPASRDHAIHYFQTWILVDEMIPSGRLSGWSERFNNGYPFGDSYPVLGYLWVAAAHLLSFGLIPLRVSYAWGIAGMWALSMWGVWTLVHMLTREFGTDESGAVTRAGWAAAIATLLWLLDPGGSRQGGWNYLMFHGVWPQQLSTALWIASLPLTLAAFVRPSPRRISGASIVLALSVLAHPFGMLTAAASCTMWPVALVIAGAPRRLPPGLWRIWLSVHALAALLTIGFVVGFLESAGFMSRNPVPWASLGSLVSDLVTGELFLGHGAWVGPLAVVGAVVVARRAGETGWLVLALFASLLVLGSHAAITALWLDLLVAGFKNLQFPRYAIALKPLYCALAGIGGMAVIAGVASLARPRTGRRPLARRLLGAALLAPLLVAIVDDIGRLVARPVGAIETLDRAEHAEHEVALFEALISERAALAEDVPMRVAFLRQGRGGGTYPIATIADAGAAIVLDGHVPSVNFRYRVRHRTSTVLRRLGVTHVLHDDTLGEKDRLLSRDLEEVGQFGPHSLHRLASGSGRPAIEMSGRGNTAQVVERTTDRLVLDVENTQDDPVRLTLTQAPYRKWLADLDGEPLELESAPQHGGAFVGSKLQIPASGQVTLRWHTPARERTAWSISALALALALAGLVFGRPLALAERQHASSALRLSWALAAMTAVLVLAIVVRKQRAQLAVTWEAAIEESLEDDKLDEPATLVRDLVIDGDAQLVRIPSRLCTGLMGKDALAGCTEAEGRLRLGMLYRSPYLFRCLDVALAPGSSAALTFSGIPENHGVLGSLRRRSQSGSGVKLRWVAVRGQPEQPPAPSALGTPRRDFYVAPGPDGTATIHLFNGTPRIEYACVIAAEIEPSPSL